MVSLYCDSTKYKLEGADKVTCISGEDFRYEGHAPECGEFVNIHQNVVSFDSLKLHH